MGGDSLHHDRWLGLDDAGQGRARCAGTEQHELIDHRLDLIEGDLSLVEQPIDGVPVGGMLDETRLELFHRHRVGPVVLNRDSELCTLDAQGCVLGDQHRRRLLMQVQAGGEDAVIRGKGIEHRRQTLGDHPVELDPERAATGERDRLPQSAGPGRPQLFEQADGSSGIAANFVHSGLLPIQLLDHDEGQHDVMFIESERGLGVGEEHTGVEDVG